MATSASYIYKTVYAIAIPLQINFNTNERLLKTTKYQTMISIEQTIVG